MYNGVTLLLYFSGMALEDLKEVDSNEEFFEGIWQELIILKWVCENLDPWERCKTWEEYEKKLEEYIDKKKLFHICRLITSYSNKTSSILWTIWTWEILLNEQQKKDILRFVLQKQEDDSDKIKNIKEVLSQEIHETSTIHVTSRSKVIDQNYAQEKKDDLVARFWSLDENISTKVQINYISWFTLKSSTSENFLLIDLFDASYKEPIRPLPPRVMNQRKYDEFIPYGKNSFFARSHTLWKLYHIPKSKSRRIRYIYEDPPQFLLDKHRKSKKNISQFRKKDITLDKQVKLKEAWFDPWPLDWVMWKKTREAEKKHQEEMHSTANFSEHIETRDENNLTDIVSDTIPTPPEYIPLPHENKAWNKSIFTAKNSTTFSMKIEWVWEIQDVNLYAWYLLFKEQYSDQYEHEPLPWKKYQDISFPYFRKNVRKKDPDFSDISWLYPAQLIESTWSRSVTIHHEYATDPNDWMYWIRLDDWSEEPIVKNQYDMYKRYTLENENDVRDDSTLFPYKNLSWDFFKTYVYDNDPKYTP